MDPRREPDGNRQDRGLHPRVAEERARSLIVAFFGTYEGWRQPHVRVLKEGFENLGDEVYECNAPLDLPTDARVAMLQRPWLAVLLPLRVAARWLRLVKISQRMPRPDVVVIGYMGHFDVHLARVMFRKSLIVLDHMSPAAGIAADRGTKSRLIIGLLRLVDRAAVASAELACVDTEPHLMTLAPRRRARGIVVPLGAESHWFQRGTPQSAKYLSVVFHGSFTPLQGSATIGDAISLLAHEPIRFTMVGKGQDLEECKRRAAANGNVEWVDWVDSAELPKLVASHDVCLGIFGTTDKAQIVVPHKVFEGAAAGCAVVTSDTEVQRAALEDAALFVPPGDPQALADAMRRLAADGGLLRHLKASARKRALEAFTPGAVVRPLRERLLREVPAR
jgi:glycosyltransferase involved in cell wall biosynthesis